LEAKSSVNEEGKINRTELPHSLMLNQGTCQTMSEGSSMLLVDHEASLNPYVQQQCPQPSITQWGINYQQLYLQTFWEENGLKPATCINICPKNDKSNENKFNSDHDKKKKQKKKHQVSGILERIIPLVSLWWVFHNHQNYNGHLPNCHSP